MDRTSGFNLFFNRFDKLAAGHPATVSASTPPLYAAPLYLDDTAIVVCIRNGQEGEYRQLIEAIRVE